ncbi:MAG: hypothetical protein IT535_11535 [Bauldia sp.]|nr:hypothetical protein [Bauldia sp.]
MAITAIQFGRMWARDFDDPHSHSVTVQVDGHAALCEIALHGTWTAGASHHSSDAYITQIISSKGVENFPNQQTTSANLIPVVFREKVTAVTFKVEVYQAKGMARWLIRHWT